MDLKEVLKDKPAYAEVFVVTKAGRVARLEELTSLEEVDENPNMEDVKVAAEKYYENLAANYPDTRMLSLGLPALELSFKDAAEHIKANTDVGKFLVEAYRDFLSFVHKRLSGELEW